MKKPRKYKTVNEERDHIKHNANRCANNKMVPKPQTSEQVSDLFPQIINVSGHIRVPGGWFDVIMDVFRGKWQNFNVTIEFPVLKLVCRDAFHVLFIHLPGFIFFMCNVIMFNF